MSRTSDFNPALAAIFIISVTAVNASPRPLASGRSQKLSSPAGWSPVCTATHRTASEANWGRRTATLPSALSSSGRQIARLGPRSSDISLRSRARRSSAIHHQGRRYSSLVIGAICAMSAIRHRRSRTSGTARQASAGGSSGFRRVVDCDRRHNASVERPAVVHRGVGLTETGSASAGRLLIAAIRKSMDPAPRRSPSQSGPRSRPS
jgi:hypothetical protein